MQAISPCFIIVLLVLCCWRLPCALSQQAAFTVFGQVRLPDGKPATRVSVKLVGVSGLSNQVITNDQGQYEFPNIPRGRYTLTVTNPDDSAQFTDPVEADTSRASGNRLLVHLFLRTSPAGTRDDRKGTVVSVAEITQQVPKKARKAYQEGLRSKAANQWDNARASFDRAIKLYPEYFQALAERGELHIVGGRIAEAAEDFRRALKVNPNYGPALRGSGYCKLEQQKFAEAAQDLEQAAALEPGKAKTYLFLGIANLATGRSQQARQALQQALNLDADQAVTAHVYLADLYSREQRYLEAAEELGTYLTLRPKAPNADRLKALEAEMRTRSKPP